MDRKTLSSWTSQHVIEIFFMFAEVVTLKCLSWMHTFEFHLFRNGKKKQCWVQVRSRGSKSLGPKNTLLHLLAYSNQVVLLQCPCWVSWYLTAYENNSENCQLAVAATSNTHASTHQCIHMCKTSQTPDHHGKFQPCRWRGAGADTHLWINELIYKV